MGNLMTLCPKCKTKIKITNTEYMRLDASTTVECTNCSLRFRAILSGKDVDELFKNDSAYPVVATEEDYILKSELLTS